MEALLKTIQSCISSNILVLFHQLHTLLGKVPIRLIGIEIRTHWTPGYRYAGVKDNEPVDEAAKEAARGISMGRKLLQEHLQAEVMINATMMRGAHRSGTETEGQERVKYEEVTQGTRHLDDAYLSLKLNRDADNLSR